MRRRPSMYDQKQQHIGRRPRNVKVSIVTTLTLLLLITPPSYIGAVSTRLAKLGYFGRPEIVQYTIEVTDINTDNDYTGSVDSTDGTTRGRGHRWHHRGRKQPQQQQKQQKPTRSLTGGSYRGDDTRSGPSTKLAELKQLFTEVINVREKLNSRRHKHQHHDSSDHHNSVHVGKMLAAVEGMEQHMRSVGMTQTANDLKSNIEKATRLYRSAPTDVRDSLKDLLQWEIDTGIHHGSSSKSNKSTSSTSNSSNNSNNSNSKVRVSNRSGAMGLFWIGHNVEYQNELYRLMLDEGKSPVEAADIAFQHTVAPHMEWATKKIARAAIPRMTPRTQTEFFSILSGCHTTNNTHDDDDSKNYSSGSSDVYDCTYGPQQHLDVTREVHSILDVWQPMIDDWKSTFDQLHLTDI